jgi:hypothetical protein
MRPPRRTGAAVTTIDLPPLPISSLAEETTLNVHGWIAEHAFTLSL